MPDKKEVPTIPRVGILFRPGDYGDKGVYTEADLEAMQGEVNVPIKMSHHPTLLDGRLGICERAFVGFDGEGKRVLMGQWREPKPLADLLRDTPRTLSVEIDRKSKQLAAVALEVNPHIQDAAFFSKAVEGAYEKFSKGEEVVPLAGYAASSKTSQEGEDMSKETEVVTEQPKGFLEQLRALFSSAKPEELEEAESEITQIRTGKTARELELEKELAKFQADAEAKARAEVEAKATERADALVAEGVVAAKGNEEYSQWLAAFSVAEQIDRDRNEYAFFSKDSPHAEFSLSAMLENVAKRLPRHDGSEQVGGHDPSVKGLAVFEQAKTTVTDPVTGSTQELSMKIAEEMLKGQGA